MAHSTQNTYKHAVLWAINSVLHLIIARLPSLVVVSFLLSFNFIVVIAINSLTLHVLDLFLV